MDSVIRRIDATSMGCWYFAGARCSHLCSACIHHHIPPAIHDQVTHTNLGRFVPARRRQARPEKPTLPQLDDWGRKRRYNEDPPIFLHYSIEWKVTVSGKTSFCYSSLIDMPRWPLTLSVLAALASSWFKSSLMRRVIATRVSTYIT